MNDITINTWSEFSELVDSLVRENRLMFRGQADSSWDLESSVTRHFKKVSSALNRYSPKNDGYGAEVARLIPTLLSEFKTASKLYVNDPKSERDYQSLVKDAQVSGHMKDMDEIGRKIISDLHRSSEFDWWSIGQHYGLATPLLDWSRSPYIAVFFAMCELHETSNGYRALWVFDFEEYNRSVSEIENPNPKVLIFNPTEKSNLRIIRQQGLFTYCSLVEAMNVSLESKFNSTNNFLRKVNIKEELTVDFIHHLDHMNVNYSSLYPDLQGSALSANLKLISRTVSLNKSHGKSRKLNDIF
jgi:hypothetical protein